MNRPHSRPVLLLHGRSGSAKQMQPLARALQREGFFTHALTFESPTAKRGLPQLAHQVQSYARHHLAEAPFDIVAFSMGGLVARYYLQRLDGLARVSRLVTLATPHHGTLAAHLAFEQGGRQMRPHSDFLRDLNGDVHRLARIACTSVATPYDLVVFPYESARLPVGRYVKIPVVWHDLMPLHRGVAQVVLEALRAPPLPVAAAAAGG